MTAIKFTGVFEAQGIGAEIFPCDVRPVKGRDQCDVATDEAFWNAVRTARTLALQDAARAGRASNGVSGVALDTRGAAPRIEGQSYGLAIYAALLGELLGIDPDEGITGSGTLGSSGELLAVKYVAAKSQRAAAERLDFIFPAATREPVSGYAADSALAGALLWLGERALAVAADGSDDPEDFVTFVEAYFSGHQRQRASETVGALLLDCARSRSVVRRAWDEQHARWAGACLDAAPQWPERSFASLRQSLFPLAPFDDSWRDPTLRGRLLVDTIQSLVRRGAATGDLHATTRRVYALLRLVRSETDLSRHLEEDMFLHAMRELFEVAERHAGRLATRELQGYLRDVYSIGHAESAVPEHLTEPLLVIDVVYERDQLAALRFSPANAEPSLLSYPAAFHDSSAALPRDMRRSDWHPAMSALDSLPNWPAIDETFGKINEFRFKPMNERLTGPTRIRWGDGTGTWPPSIDTLHLIGTLKRHGFYASNASYDSVFDLGCGTGVHGILIARHAAVGRLDFIDIEPGARKTTGTNMLLNFEPVRPDPAVFATPEDVPFRGLVSRFAEGEAVSHLEGRAGRYDLMICTPPYVPFLDILRNPTMWQAVAGTDLLRWVLLNARRFARRTIVQFSEIALPEVEDAIGNAKLLDSHAVGFRVPPLMRYFSDGSPSDVRALGAAWLERVRPHLVDTERSSDPHVSRYHHGFRFFHRIRTYMIE